jgi:hypothetical protein
MGKEPDLYIANRANPQQRFAAVQMDIRFNGQIDLDGPGGDIVGEVDVEVIANNIVITVRREDEAYFGPVSLVVV